jgi:ABC-2 type transport system ATP-binding protein
MGRVAIEVDDVTKVFKINHQKVRSLKEKVIFAGRNPVEEFHALRDVSFEVLAGETFALFGHNGSGKSTLLKCIAGTLRPTRGRTRAYGRMAALLELGAGFHPDLSGRENVYLNASILGFSSAEVDVLFDDIVAFAELEHFVDLPLKHFSSGMVARLGFAVAINVDPEVLLIDEVLSVGDEAFQRKCLEQIRLLQRDGRTILVVTHAVDVARQISDRAAVLDHGELLAVDEPGEAIRVFREALLRRGIALEEAGMTVERRLTGTARLAGVHVHHGDGRRPALTPGRPMVVSVAFESDVPNDDFVVAINVFDDLGNLVLGANSMLLGSPLTVGAGPGTYEFRFESVPLNSGIYQLATGLHGRDGVEYDHVEKAGTFQVSSESLLTGRVWFPLTGGFAGTGAS